jgi:hypothetical protein
MTRPNEQRAKAAVILLLMVIALDGISLISLYSQYQMLRGWKYGMEVSIDVANANDMRQGIIAVLQLMVLLGSAITFIMWFRRAYWNLSQKINLNYSDGWAAGCWLVPFLNLWRPYQMMKEMYNEARQYLANENSGGETLLGMRFLGIWWTAWILNSILGQAASRMTMHSNSFEEYLNATVMDMISTSISIPAAMLAIKVIRDYAKIEPLLAVDNPLMVKQNQATDILDN